MKKFWIKNEILFRLGKSLIFWEWVLHFADWIVELILIERVMVNAFYAAVHTLLGIHDEIKLMSILYK